MQRDARLTLAVINKLIAGNDDGSNPERSLAK